MRYINAIYHYHHYKGVFTRYRYEFIPVLTSRSVFVYMVPWKISYRYEFIPVLTYRSVFVYMVPV